MHGIFDTHAHYTDPRFEAEYEGGSAALLDRLFSSEGVERVVNVGTNTVNSAAAVAQAAGYPGMYCAVGVHPTDIVGEKTREEALELLRGWIREREYNSVVAIGEIGLDYYWKPFDREEQLRWFNAQLELAGQTGMPVIVHDREAHGDVFETVLKHPGVRGVMHSFSGSAEMAGEYVRRGWYISFSGVLTFRNAARVREVASKVPVDRLLLETDCPYLAPEPMRGKLNHSDYIRYTAAVMGSLFGLGGAEMIDRCYSNACDLFGL